MPTSILECVGWSPSSGHESSSLPTALLDETVKVLVVKSLPFAREMWVEFMTPGFGVDQTQLLQRFVGVYLKIEDLFLTLSFSLSSE